MKKIKLIITFILLVSLFLGVVACTPDEESKADVSENVSETVSEDEPDVSIDENIFRIRNQLKPYGQGEIILVDKYKGDRKLYMVTLSTSDSIINEKVIADAFYDEYGMTFSEAFKKYCPDNDDSKKYRDAFDKIEADVSPLLPDFKEKMLNELKSTHNVDNIILDERLIEDLADVVVTEPEMSFYPYRIQLLVYANPAEAEMLEEEYSIVAFGEKYDWDNWGDGVYSRLSYLVTMIG